MLWETLYQGYFEFIFNEGSRSKSNRNSWIKNSGRTMSHKKDGIWPWEGKGCIFSGHREETQTRAAVYQGLG